MSGDLWAMARNGTTLLPSEVKKLAADYDRLRSILAALREPSDAVLKAAARFETLEGLRAAVAAAEKEVGGDT